MKRELPKAGELWHHFKGGFYKIICVGHHSETGEKMVVYQPCKCEKGSEFVMDLDRLVGLREGYKVTETQGEPCIRPLSMFMSFTEMARYPDAKQEFRFIKVNEIS
jgi:hypothetical protein